MHASSYQMVPNGKTTKLLGFKGHATELLGTYQHPPMGDVVGNPKGFSQKMAPPNSTPIHFGPTPISEGNSGYGEIIFWLSFWRENFPGRCKGHGTLILLAYPLEVCGMVLSGSCCPTCFGVLREIPKSWGILWGNPEIPIKFQLPSRYLFVIRVVSQACWHCVTMKLEHFEHHSVCQAILSLALYSTPPKKTNSWTLKNHPEFHSLVIHGTGIYYLHEWLIFIVFHVGKYTDRPMDPSWDWIFQLGVLP